MGFARQLIAFGGIVLVGSTLLLNGEALAFGQQWRPAPGFGPTQPGNYNRVARMPGFRPHAAARPVFGQPSNRIEQRPYRLQPYQRQTFQPRFAAREGYPAHRGTMPYTAGFYPPQPGFFAAGYPGAGWAPPFTAMAQPWGQQVPLFARQFAWRPAGHPWVARAPMRQRPGYRVRMAPNRVGYRPAGPAYPPPAGSWRPTDRPRRAIQPQFAYQGRIAQRPVHIAGQQPMSRAAPGYPVTDARVAGLNRPPVAAARGHWRPQAAPAVSWGSSGPFRPQAYGRSLAARKEVARRDTAGSGFTRNNLPGWVTTYQETAYEDSCGWCSGS